MKNNYVSPVRGAGILMSIGSLPSEYGIGTMGRAAYNFIDLLADLKMRYWQILPIGPLSYGNSPYQPISAFAGNNYLIDLDELVKLGLLKTEEIREYDWGRDAEDIDYANMYRNRVKILKTAYERFDTGDAAYNRFIKDNAGWLDDYALFRAIKEANRDVSWTEWDKGLKNREKDALDRARSTLKDSIGFYSFCQYMFHMQWDKLHAYAGGKGISIIGDVSLYVAHDSADVWSERENFQLNEDGSPKFVSAVPSDEFSPKGQIWGSPVYNWDVMDGNDFGWWRMRMKKACEMFDLVRLDHFIGAVKYYAVSPQSGRSDSGRWYKGPSRNFMDAISDVMADTTLIVDDAGPRTIVPGVKKLIDKWGLTCSRILVFGWDKGSDNDNLIHNYEGNDIAVYTTTHDTRTLVGYIEDLAASGSRDTLNYMSRYMGIDISDELSAPNKVTHLSDETVRTLARQCIRVAYASTADIAIIPIQDVLELGNEARMNAPSTVFGNWQWRVGTHTLSESQRAFLIDMAFLYRR